METTFHENRFVGLLLTFIGGGIDAFTYYHFNTFAATQTGNLVLAIIDAVKGEFTLVGEKLLSTLFFFLGIILTKFLVSYFRKKNHPFWRLGILYFETLVFFMLSLFIVDFPITVITIIISFATAMQWCSFERINGMSYTSIMTTGNLKSMATNLFDYLEHGKEQNLRQFFHYLFVVMSFFAGAFTIALLSHHYHFKAIRLTALLFFGLALSQTYQMLKLRKIMNP
ncbi:hypothetical protein CIRMBP1197_00386 [Enterococcus cecorum]|nr:hypothetical protein CIRMBP1197_00386 [Enterococcus cecorum]